MRIAILGWGSLIWDPRELPYNGNWEGGGPSLPIEFSRISDSYPLTLVIDPKNGAEVPTQYAISTRKTLEDAICDLRCREGTSNTNIGYIDLESDLLHSREMLIAVQKIMPWAQEGKFDGIVWTDLDANFERRDKKPFTVDDAIAYLSGLPPDRQENGRKYIRNAPGEVQTPLREKLIEIGCLADAAE